MTIADIAVAAADAFDDAERRYLLRRETPAQPRPRRIDDDAMIPPILGPAVGRRRR